MERQLGALVDDALPPVREALLPAALVAVDEYLLVDTPGMSADARRPKPEIPTPHEVGVARFVQKTDDVRALVGKHLDANQFVLERERAVSQQGVVVESSSEVMAAHVSDLLYPFPGFRAASSNSQRPGPGGSVTWVHPPFVPTTE